MNQSPDDVRSEWSRRDGEYSPGYYAHYGPNDTSEAVRAFLDETVGRDASVLELGCSSGRHLAHLHDNGYTDLAGVDINPDSERVMREHYPDLARDGDFHYDAIEAVTPDFDTDAFDAVYSVETLQHIHTDDEWVFEDIARVAATTIATAEIEDGDEDDAGVTYVRDDFPLYYRNWRDVFEPHGFTQVEAKDVGRDTLRGFVSNDD